MELLTRWPRWARRLLIVALVLAALTLLLRLLLDPIATAVTRRALGRMKGLRGDLEGVHVTLFGPGYTVERLKLIQVPGGRWQEPIFYAERAHVGLDWRRLLRGKLVAHARLDEPKITVVGGRGENRGAPPEAPDVAGELGKLMRLKIDRLEIRGGEVLFRDAALPHHPELWLHRLELAAENLATRQTLAGARPATLAASGVLGRSGDVRLFVSADPFATPLEFAGRFELRGLRASELYEFIEPKEKLEAGSGTIDLFAEFEAKNGVLEGGVKPVLKNVRVEPTTDGLGKRLEAWLANLGIKLASDRVPGRNAVATVVPIRGRITGPDVELWPAVFGVIRNAFVEGIASGFAHLPPPEAGKKQSLLQQGREALDKDKAAPKAQPTDGEQRGHE